MTIKDIVSVSKEGNMFYVKYVRFDGSEGRTLITKRELEEMKLRVEISRAINQKASNEETMKIMRYVSKLEKMAYDDGLNERE